VYGIVVAAAAAAVDATADQIIFQHRCSQFSLSHFREILPVYVSFFLQSRVGDRPVCSGDRAVTAPAGLASQVDHLEKVTVCQLISTQGLDV